MIATSILSHNHSIDSNYRHMSHFMYDVYPAQLHVAIMLPAQGNFLRRRAQRVNLWLQDTDEIKRCAHFASISYQSAIACMGKNTPEIQSFYQEVPACP
jgi:hypothetical protein